MGIPALRFSQSDKPDILSVLEREGITFQQKGRTFWACCPLHTEKTPSFKIDPERQTFYCFGCHKKGDVLTLVMELHGLSFKEAQSYLGIKGLRSKPNPSCLVETRKSKELLEAFIAWEKELCDLIAFALRRYRRMTATREPPLRKEELEGIAYLQGEADYLEYVYEILCGKNDADKYELFRQEKGY